MWTADVPHRSNYKPGARKKSGISASIFHNIIIKILIQIKDLETIIFVVILMTIQVRV